jgi:triphosphatase
MLWEGTTVDSAGRFPTSPQAVKAAPVKLRKRMNAEQAFAAIARNCVDQLHDNHAGVVANGDPEFLHQMRVGLRRLDAAFKLFRDFAPPPLLAAELEWLKEVLGPARDWDVFTDATLPLVIAAMREEDGIVALRQAACGKRDAIRTAAGAAVASARFARLLASLDARIAQRGWRAGMSAGMKRRVKINVADAAAAILELEQRRLLKRGRKLNDSDPHQRHHMRMAAKRTRYASEFFASLYKGATVRPYGRALISLQDELGALNDALIATRLLDTASANDGGLGIAAASVRGYLAARCGQGLRSVQRLWKQFKQIAPPH